MIGSHAAGEKLARGGTGGNAMNSRSFLLAPALVLALGGAAPGTTHASHTAFINPISRMSVR